MKKNRAILIFFIIYFSLLTLAVTSHRTIFYDFSSAGRDEFTPKVILAEVTAYSEIDSCHYPGCIMASGERAYTGAIACPRELDLGLRVRIGDEFYVCEDRTAKRFNGRFDIFMGYGPEAHQKALEFGINELEVVISR
jgi:3D (Asp-Asp-Asp) domain-containing protein